MKRLALFIGIVVGLVASCSTKEIDLQTPVQDDVVFYASFEQPSDIDTRVYATEDLLLRWTADDRVSIYNKNTYNQQYAFTGETGDNAGGFRKVESDEFMTGNAISNVVSVYPYQTTTKITENEVITVNLPAEQTYAENTFGLGANTMVSVTSDNFLQYKNVGGYLMLKLYGEGVYVSSITLRGNSAERIAGTASVTMPFDGVPTTMIATDATDEITLTCTTPVRLGSTENESTRFWFVVPPITFNNGFSITVHEATGEIFEKSTHVSVSIKRNVLSKMSPIEVDSSTIPYIPIPDAVDLGLSVKWASFNLGASKPEEYGDYYAWGETETKSVFSWSTYKWCNGTGSSLTKYNTNSSYGTVDNKTTLETGSEGDDVASKKLGGFWRMPTDQECTELRTNCTWTWTTQNGVYGRLVTSKLNGNSIFIPAAGRWYETLFSLGSTGIFWSSSLNTTYGPNCAWNVFFNSSDMGRYNNEYRYIGLSVRPVYAE